MRKVPSTKFTQLVSKITSLKLEIDEVEKKITGLKYFDPPSKFHNLSEDKLSLLLKYYEELNEVVKKYNK